MIPSSITDITSESGQLILVDKPLTWTSFDVVKKIKSHFKLKKIGHAGTLDPLATGLLLLGTGPKTKMLQELQGLNKRYAGTFTVGKTTPSYDLETAFENEVSFDHLTEEEIRKAAQSMTGAISQVPPVFSAIKVKGKRAYIHARNGEDIKLEARTVIIEKFEITRIALPEIDFDIICTKGTYIRSMARDFGENLKVGAHLSSLKRTAIGNYDIKDAWPLGELVTMKAKE